MGEGGGVMLKQQNCRLKVLYVFNRLWQLWRDSLLYLIGHFILDKVMFWHQFSKELCFLCLWHTRVAVYPSSSSFIIQRNPSLILCTAVSFKNLSRSVSRDLLDDLVRRVAAALEESEEQLMRLDEMSRNLATRWVTLSFRSSSARKFHSDTEISETEIHIL